MAGSLTKGHLWRHDDARARRGPDGSLVSCSESLSIVDLPEIGRQMEFPTEPDELASGEEHPEQTTEMVLF
ncbi:hypothetical protein ABZ438_20725 [Streptomyces sp. NPDC005786]|uniref:hypothetical protein n=1 Tax=Streptomyces sp. NPDC005786 TaxID=3154891 RepID=UPI0033C08BAE